MYAWGDTCVVPPTHSLPVLLNPFSTPSVSSSSLCIPTSFFLPPSFSSLFVHLSLTFPPIFLISPHPIFLLLSHLSPCLDAPCFLSSLVIFQHTHVSTQGERWEWKRPLPSPPCNEWLSRGSHLCLWHRVTNSTSWYTGDFPLTVTRYTVRELLPPFIFSFRHCLTTSHKIKHSYAHINGKNAVLNADAWWHQTAWELWHAHLQHICTKFIFVKCLIHVRVRHNSSMWSQCEVE